jgi:hypothetical protein
VSSSSIGRLAQLTKAVLEGNSRKGKCFQATKESFFLVEVASSRDKIAAASLR